MKSSDDLHLDTPHTGVVSAQMYDVSSASLGIRDSGGVCRFHVQRQSSSGPFITIPKVVLLWWSTYLGSPPH